MKHNYMVGYHFMTVWQTPALPQQVREVLANYSRWPT